MLLQYMYTRLPSCYVLHWFIVLWQIENFERNAIWRSFFALVAFLVFFLLERVINILGEIRERRRKESREKKVRLLSLSSHHEKTFL